MTTSKPTNTPPHTVYDLDANAKYYVPSYIYGYAIAAYAVVSQDHEVRAWVLVCWFVWVCVYVCM